MLNRRRGFRQRATDKTGAGIVSLFWIAVVDGFVKRRQLVLKAWDVIWNIKMPGFVRGPLLVAIYRRLGCSGRCCCRNWLGELFNNLRDGKTHRADQGAVNRPGREPWQLPAASASESSGQEQKRPRFL